MCIAQTTVICCACHLHLMCMHTKLHSALWYSNKFEVTKNFEQVFTRFADYASTDSISAKEPELVTEIYRQLSEDIFSRACNNW